MGASHLVMPAIMHDQHVEIAAAPLSFPVLPRPIPSSTIPEIASARPATHRSRWIRTPKVPLSLSLPAVPLALDIGQGLSPIFEYHISLTPLPTSPKHLYFISRWPRTDDPPVAIIAIRNSLVPSAACKRGKRPTPLVAFIGHHGFPG